MFPVPISYLEPFEFAPTPVGPTVARSAPLGPVTGPRLALRKHPLLQRDGRLLLGSVTCAKACRVGVSVKAAGGELGAGLTVHGTQRLIVPAFDTRLDRQLTVSVRIGSAPLVRTVVPPDSVVAAPR